jgi:hypothetical protein
LSSDELMTTVLVISSFEDKAGLGGIREHIGLAPFLPAKDMIQGLFDACDLIGICCTLVAHCLTPTFETTNQRFLGTVLPAPGLEQRRRRRAV